MTDNQQLTIIFNDKVLVANFCRLFINPPFCAKWVKIGWINKKVFKRGIFIPIIRMTVTNPVGLVYLLFYKTHVSEVQKITEHQNNLGWCG